jgi:hypothetical protein
MKLIDKTQIGKYSNKDLARIYGCSIRTIQRNIKGIRAKLGPRVGQRWSYEQAQMIITHLTPPYELLDMVSEPNTPALIQPMVIKFHTEEFSKDVRKAG